MVPRETAFRPENEVWDAIRCASVITGLTFCSTVAASCGSPWLFMDEMSLLLPCRVVFAGIEHTFLVAAIDSAYSLVVCFLAHLETWLPLEGQECLLL